MTDQAASKTPLWERPELVVPLLTLGLPVYGALQSAVALGFNRDFDVSLYQAVNQPLPALAVNGVFPLLTVLLGAGMGMFLGRTVGHRLHPSNRALEVSKARTAEIRKILDSDDPDLDEVDDALDHAEELLDRASTWNDRIARSLKIAALTLGAVGILLAFLVAAIPGAWMVGASGLLYLGLTERVRGRTVDVALVALSLGAGLAAAAYTVPSAVTARIEFVPGSSLDGGDYIQIPQNGDQVLLIDCDAPADQQSVTTVSGQWIESSVRLGHVGDGPNNQSGIDLLTGDESFDFGLDESCVR